MIREYIINRERELLEAKRMRRVWRGLKFEREPKPRYHFNALSRYDINKMRGNRKIKSIFVPGLKTAYRPIFGASPAQYYVADSDGNDGYNGLYPSYVSGSDGPWKTIQYAVNQVSAGDLIDVRTGTYTSNAGFNDAASGTSGSVITLQNYQSDTVTISASAGSKALWCTDGCDYWTLDGLILQRADAGHTVVIGTAGNSDGHDYWTVKNCTFHGTFQINGHDLLFEDNTVIGTVNDGDNGAGIEELGEAGKNLSYNNTYRGNTIYDFTTRGIWLQGRCHDDIMEDNTIYNIGEMGIDADGYNRCQWDHIVRDNLIYDCDEDAIEFENCYNSLAERNICIRCDIQAITVINYSTGEVGGDSNEYGVAGDHRGLDTQNVIRDNLVRDGAGNGLVIYDAGGVSFFFNTVYANDCNVYLRGTASDYFTGLDMRGNIFSQAASAEISVDVDITHIDTDDYNILDPGGVVYEKRDAPYASYTLAQYRTATGNAGNTIESSPAFKDAVNDDYTLTVSSPAIQLVPVNVTDHTIDLVEAPRNRGTMDAAGCYEYYQTIARRRRD